MTFSYSESKKEAAEIQEKEQTHLLPRERVFEGILLELVESFLSTLDS